MLMMSLNVVAAESDDECACRILDKLISFKSRDFRPVSRLIWLVGVLSFL